MDNEKNTLENEMSIEILISTMNRTSLSFLNTIFPYHNLEDLNILVVNQTQKGSELFSDKNNIRVLNSFDKGLSKSRNFAIKNAIGDICIIADDDIEYLSDFKETILESFLYFKDASVILFKIKTFCDKAYKLYPSKSTKLRKIKDIANSSSVEIAFKRKDIIQTDSWFNVLFGLGSVFKSSEEYLFLKGLLLKDMNIYFQNKYVVKHALTRSTSNIGTDDFIKAKSAIFYDDYKTLSYLYLLKFIFFLVRNRIITIKSIGYKFNKGIQAISVYKNFLNEGK